MIEMIKLTKSLMNEFITSGLNIENSKCNEYYKSGRFIHLEIITPDGIVWKIATLNQLNKFIGEKRNNSINKILKT